MSLVACSSDSTGGTTADAAPASETGTDGGSDTSTAADTAPAALNGCNNFVDRTATGASRTITWDFPVSTAPERCMTIKKGQEVTWSGDFAEHPLMAKGGDMPNPIAGAEANAGKATFATAGTFGFECGNHPSMTGVIKVTE